MHFLRYILFCIFIGLSFIGISKEIIIDNFFKTEDVYNSLLTTEDDLQSDYITYKAILYNTTSNSKKLAISVINPIIDTIELIDKNQHLYTGDKFSFNKKRNEHYNNVYFFNIAPNEKRNIQIRIKKQWKSVHVKINIASFNEFIKATNHDNFYLGIYFGIVFMYILLLICFYIFSKSNFFLIYLSIILFVLIFIFQFSGIGFIYIWPNSIFIQNNISTFALIGYLSAHYIFIRSFFSVQFKSNYSGIILKIMVYILVFFAGLFILQSFKNDFTYKYSFVIYELINILFVVYGIIIVLLCFYSYRASKQREIIWVFVAATMHFTNWLLFINNIFGSIHFLNYFIDLKFFSSNIFIPQLTFFILILEIFVTTIFIGISYHQLIRQNTISSKRLDFLQKRNINTFVVGQEAEREKISTLINQSISVDIKNFRTQINDFKPINDEKNILPFVLQELDKTLEDIEHITQNYVAPDLEKMALIAIITTATDKLYTHLEVQYEFKKIADSFLLNPISNINIYRILQEISNNILKHANAKTVIISAMKDNNSLQIKIMDDGIGFGDSVSNSKGIGILNIESRVSSLNGHFYILSNENDGAMMNIIFNLNDIL